MSKSLEGKLADRKAKVSVVGLGYVGLPLAVEMARAGFQVTGLDVDEERAAQINAAKSYIRDVSDAELEQAVRGRGIGGRLRATCDFTALAEMDAVSICVPTPLGKTRDPDVSHVLAVRDQIRKHIHAEMAMILESTTYPGTTEEIFVPLIQEAGLRLGEDVFLAFSPERIDPANKAFSVRNTPKVIGGITPACTKMVVKFYGTFIDRLVPVSSARVAEMVKILENTYRAVNIGLVNEVAIMCRLLGIDTWEVIEAAATKPFGFTPFYPGPGLGGHCIPVDPHYLSWKLKTLDYTARFIHLAAEVNRGMPLHVVNLVADKLNSVEKSVRGSRILLLGVAYKPDVTDMRESPALDVFRLLEEKGAKVEYNDPHVPEFRMDHRTVRSTELTDGLLAEQDLIVILTHHSAYDYDRVVGKSRAVVDTRNATKGIENPKIVRL